MKWDIDRALKQLEPESCPGTTISHALVDVKLLLDPIYRYGVEPTEEERREGHVTLWCLSLGYSWAVKAMFYGRTIHDCYMKARRAAKMGRLAEHSPWGSQMFTPPKRKAKKRDRKASPRKQADSSV